MDHYISQFVPEIQSAFLNAQFGATFSSDSVLEQIPSSAASVEAQLHSHRQASAVSDFIAGLSPRERRIVIRLYWEDETQTAVAADLGISRMAVCKIVRKIREKGRRALQEWQPVFEN